MKSLIRTISLAACVLIASCSKQNQTENADAAPATSEPVATAPEPKTVAVATPAPTKNLAPDGTFFLLVKKSVETPDGIIGLAPGTKIRQQADGRYSADGHFLELKPSEMTNDLDLAARYAGADARAQAAIKETLQAHATAPKAGAPTTTKAGASTASSVAAAPRATSPPPVAPSSSGTLLGQNSALGSAHTKVQGGWVYQKDATGNWIPVRPTR